MRYDPGEADGILAGKTVMAIMDYEFENKLEITGEVSQDLVDRLRASYEKGHQYEKPETQQRKESKTQVVNQLPPEQVILAEALLTRFAYDCGEPDGIVRGDTVAAVLDDQFENGLPTSGDIDKTLIAHMQSQLNACE